MKKHSELNLVLFLFIKVWQQLVLVVGTHYAKYLKMKKNKNVKLREVIKQEA